jgi:hypothetical protein
LNRSARSLEIKISLPCTEYNNNSLETSDPSIVTALPYLSKF